MKDIGAGQHFPRIDQQGQKADGLQRDHLGLSNRPAQRQRRLFSIDDPPRDAAVLRIGFHQLVKLFPKRLNQKNAAVAMEGALPVHQGNQMHIAGPIERQADDRVHQFMLGLNQRGRLRLLRDQGQRFLHLRVLKDLHG